MTVQLQSSEDEVACYLQRQYIEPTEAIWHLFKFDVHGENSPVIHLAIHLLSQQSVQFNNTSTVTEIHEQMKRVKSTLMTFF